MLKKLYTVYIYIYIPLPMVKAPSPCLCRLICMWLITVCDGAVCGLPAGTRTPASCATSGMFWRSNSRHQSPTKNRYVPPPPRLHARCHHDYLKECVCTSLSMETPVGAGVIRGRANTILPFFSFPYFTFSLFLCLFLNFLGAQILFNWVVYRRDHWNNKDGRILCAIKSLLSRGHLSFSLFISTLVSPPSSSSSSPWMGEKVVVFIRRRRGD